MWNQRQEGKVCTEKTRAQLVARCHFNAQGGKGRLLAECLLSGSGWYCHLSIVPLNYRQAATSPASTSKYTKFLLFIAGNKCYEKNRRNQHTISQEQPKHIRLPPLDVTLLRITIKQCWAVCIFRSKYLHATCDLSVSVGCTWTIFESPVARGVQIWSKADVSSDNRVSACPE